MLRGREKFKCGRATDIPFIDASEVMDGDRGGCTGIKGDNGECGADMPLLDDSLRGFEKEEPVTELL